MISKRKLWRTLRKILRQLIARVLIPPGSVVSDRPICIRQTFRVVKLFVQIAQSLCLTKELVQRELEKKPNMKASEFMDELFIDVQQGNRFFEYTLGPRGWSSDGSIRKRRFFGIRKQNPSLSFVGMRKDLVIFPHHWITVFTARHELQHEIQRDEGKSDEHVRKRFKRRFSVEYDANKAAQLMVLKFSILRRYSLYRYCPYLYFLSLLCAFGYLGKLSILLLMILFYVFLSPYIPTLLRLLGPALVLVWLVTAVEPLLASVRN